MMTADRVYNFHQALKLHFTTDKYDFFKYRGKIANKNTNGKSALHYSLLARRWNLEKDVKGLFVSNMVSGHASDYVRYFYSEEASKTYRQWQGRTESLTYNVQQDAAKFQDLDIIDFVVPQPGKDPPLLRAYYAKQVSLETLTVYAVTFGFIDAWRNELSHNILWPDTQRLVTKYRPFLNIDGDRFRPIILRAHGREPLGIVTKPIEQIEKRA